jgi:hypothetical protein
MRAIGGRRTVEGYGGNLCVMDGQHRNPTHGRQGKRPASSAAYVVGKIEDFANTTDTPCWRCLRFSQRNQSAQRRRSQLQRRFRP